jgi:hypothetical protein
VHALVGHSNRPLTGDVASDACNCCLHQVSSTDGVKKRGTRTSRISQHASITIMQLHKEGRESHESHVSRLIHGRTVSAIYTQKYKYRKVYNRLVLT